MHCPVCESTKSHSYLNQAWNEDGQEYKLLKCEECELIWTSPLPSDELLGRIYGRTYGYEWYADHLLFKRLDCKKRVVEMRPYLGQSVLDYGGGLGYLAEACRKQGLVSQVYDPYHPSNNKELSGKWDSIVSLHALEHSNNLERTLQDYKKILGKGGRVLVSVPNAKSSSYEKYGMQAVWAQPPFIHIFHFSEKNLRILFEKNGFSVEKISFADRWDANTLNDVLLAPLFRRIDSAWNKFKSIKPIRRIYALITGSLRLISLWATRVCFKRQDQEINIVCKLMASGAPANGSRSAEPTPST